MRIFIVGIDGYLGWALAVYLADKGYKVGGCDNLSRRKQVKEIGSHSAIPIKSINTRLRVFKKHFEYRPFFKFADVCQYSQIYMALHEFKPDAIVHLGEMPSAPYSMIDVHHCNFTMYNNLIGTLNILWAMKATCPEAQLIKLGTMGEYGCYDKKTEILTENGWKLFQNLEKNDKVATRTKKNRELKFKKPNSVHEYDFNGDLYYVKGKRIDLLVTPNHRMFTLGRLNNGYSHLRKEYIKDIFNKDRVYEIGLSWKGKDCKNFILPAIDKFPAKKISMDIWLEFLGWFLSEGCIPHRKERKFPSRIEIRQKLNKIQPIIDIANLICYKFGLKQSLYKEKDGMGKIVIWSKQLAVYLDKYGKAKDKYIDKKIKNLPKSKLNILLKSLLLGDGWVHNEKRKNYRYFTISRKLADNVQEIALKCGYSANISNRNGGYQVNLCGTTCTHVNHGEKNDGWIPYRGKVYCVNVGGDGIVMVRRNGLPVWCGNTPNIDIPEGFFKITYRGRKDTLPFPRQAGSFYHWTKVDDSYHVNFACKIWGLTSTDIMQGPVFGTKIDEMHGDSRLATRFDFDCHFGTCINQYCAEAVVGHPLTVFGKGGQKRGFLPLCDSMQCIKLIIDNPPKPGEYRIVNQFQEVYNVYELAEIVQKVANTFDFLPVGMPKVEIRNIENPRIEAEEHYYNPDCKILPGLGYKPQQTVEEGIFDMLYDLYDNKGRILKKKHVLIPDIRWDGTHRKSEEI